MRDGRSPSPRSSDFHFGFPEPWLHPGSVIQQLGCRTERLQTSVLFLMCLYFHRFLMFFGLNALLFPNSMYEPCLGAFRPNLSAETKFIKLPLWVLAPSPEYTLPSVTNGQLFSPIEGLESIKRKRASCFF